MPKILITPEYVRKLSGDFRAAANENLARINSLNTQMEDLRAQWEGASREKFYADFEKAKATMNAYSPLLEGIGTELSQIGQRFAEADQQARAQTQATSSAQASASDQQAASQTDSTMQAPAENVADTTAASPTQESAPDQQATSQADSTTQAMDQAQTDASTPAPDQAASTAPAPDQAASPLPEQAQTDTYLTLRGPQLDGKDTYIQITQAEYDQWATLPTEDQTSFLNNLPPERIMVLSSEDTATVATTLDQAMADSTTQASAEYVTDTTADSTAPAPAEELVDINSPHTGYRKMADVVFERFDEINNQSVTHRLTAEQYSLYYNSCKTEDEKNAFLEKFDPR